MHLRRRVVVQLAVFSVITIVATSVMALSYMRLPWLLFNANHYDVALDLSNSAGLYERAVVNYRGVEVGKVKRVHLTDDGVQAILSLKSDVPIPSDLDASVHSQTAVGEQYVELSPRDNTSSPLRDGDIIPQDRASVPPDINSLLDATNRGLTAIPGDSLKTVIDESAIAFGGLGPELSRFVRGSTTLIKGAQRHLSDLTNLVDNAAPILDTQTETSDSVRAWAAHTAEITGQLQARNDDLAGVLINGPAALEEGRALLDRLRPTLPILLANLATVAPVLLTYQPNVEQMLVLLPKAVEMVQAATLADSQIDSPYRGINIDFNLNFNLPPPCMTGYLPAEQMRSVSEVDHPDRPEGDLYCRIPQDSMFGVRGARNIPCAGRPGKRAPTAKMCESNENYVPLNDGFNWKGDPNATMSGQDVPQLAPGMPSQGHVGDAPVPVAAAEYDPETGRYIGPDGKTYTQSNLDAHARDGQTWQSLILPPTS
ncbi:MCE family protein [[Mycobacterium] burgundiense]|uniref:MlaD family protein n=1 Tax=[Mycobacterium] burgundiense TaxID=3064286 RepID=A0ABM9M4C9_9MYCO|nr:MlaD family protein [Mycolicibacterium sp. MU0053]CAJ1510020.1 MlaD family protein [Mycolicibacterium sp. MU0053]